MFFSIVTLNSNSVFFILSSYFHKNAACVQLRCKAAEQINIKLTASSFRLVGSGILVCRHHYVEKN